MNLFDVNKSEKKVFVLDMNNEPFKNYAEFHGGRTNAVTTFANLARAAIKQNEEVIEIQDASRGRVRSLNTVDEINAWERQNL